MKQNKKELGLHFRDKVLYTTHPLLPIKSHTVNFEPFASLKSFRTCKYR